MKQFIILFICLHLGLAGMYSQNTINMEVEETIAAKVDSILSLMTLEEKVGQMVQYNGSWDVTGPATGTSEERKLENMKNGLVGSMLNVTSVEHTREAQRIIMENSRLKIPLIFGYDVIHGYQTMFPIPLGESSSWDLDLMRRTAAVAARETAASGVHWTFAPMMDVARDARWGRVMEGAGEDPYLNSVVAVARINGFQGGDLSNSKTVAACAKHFAGYGLVEAGREYNSINIGIHELHNTVLPPFKAAAKAGVATFMNSFSEVDGVPATASSYLQRDLLKEEWKWNGFVVSDWASIKELITHGLAADKSQAAEIAIKAGSDMDMEGGAYESSLEQLVEEGKLDVALINDAVKRILYLKYELGLFDDPFRYCDEELEKKELYSDENRKVALEAAKKSIVLLKNEDNILPLNKKGQTIAVIGPLADDKDSPLGNWRAHAVSNSAVSVLEGIKNHAPEGTKITYAQGASHSTGKRAFQEFLTINETDTSGFKNAVSIAKEADVVLLVVGEDAYQSGEGRSQTEIGFTGVQNELIEAITKANKNVVMVLMNGRPMDISESEPTMKGILETWFLGSEHGNAVGEVVFGKYNPSGKLTASFPRSVGQLPIYYNRKNTGRPNGGSQVTFSHYIDEETDALYPFGYGLSYSNFEYSEIALDKPSFSEGGKITASVNVTNTSDVAGEEIVQLYIWDFVASIARPIKELKAFEKISLKAGETKKVDFSIDEEMITFFTINKKWEAEPGRFKLYIGSSSVDLMENEFEYN